MRDSKFDVRSQAQMVEVTLDLLVAVADDANISQRGLARRLGVALGLTNVVLKRCAKKGWLKIRQAPAHRFAYYLTPKGFAEKTRLTAEYLSYSMEFYRDMRQDYVDLFQHCADRGWDRTILVGTTELTEIATLAVHNSDVTLVGILDPGKNESHFCGLPVYQSLSEIAPEHRPKAVILADISAPQSVYGGLIEVLPRDRVLAPRLMRITQAIEIADENEDGLEK